MKKVFVLAALAVTVFASSSVFAHGEKAKHGGIVQESSNGVSLELVAKEGRATIYVEDHGKPVATSGAIGKLTVLNGTDKSEVPLEPAGENTLISKGDAKLASGAKVIAAITLADKKTANVRFAIK
ncbi:hypothetical protein [Noviherbaspirillum denitrificans]|uniref:DUF5666 domain-containing protein n=1 Tax=Noviherbaspirillum denitrificans TaxID=1968433 RepID=A0A254TGP1_9BURK|nr:hypothetical protein [Noviherbaspirillum denitrificans]OWW21829.1 hypothetical protein AYR66_22370 [Noviherbaspirillum denitrificans]